MGVQIGGAVVGVEAQTVHREALPLLAQGGVGQAADDGHRGLAYHIARSLLHPLQHPGEHRQGGVGLQLLFQIGGVGIQAVVKEHQPRETEGGRLSSQLPAMGKGQLEVPLCQGEHQRIGEEERENGDAVGYAGQQSHRVHAKGHGNQDTQDAQPTGLFQLLLPAQGHQGNHCQGQQQNIDQPHQPFPVAAGLQEPQCLRPEHVIQPGDKVPKPALGHIGDGVVGAVFRNAGDFQNKNMADVVEHHGGGNGQHSLNGFDVNLLHGIAPEQRQQGQHQKQIDGAVDVGLVDAQGDKEEADGNQQSSFLVYRRPHPQHHHHQGEAVGVRIVEKGGVHQGHGAVGDEHAAGEQHQGLAANAQQPGDHIGRKGHERQLQKAVEGGQGEIASNQPVHRPEIPAHAHHGVGAFLIEVPEDVMGEIGVEKAVAVGHQAKAENAQGDPFEPFQVQPVFQATG